MSKSEDQALQKGRGEPENASVYDFLYHDSRRIASFLAQFDENGLLTGLTRGESATKGARRGSKFEIGADIPIGGGHISYERSPGESGAESLERAYDPFWANAREFLDALDSRNMIQRDIKSASIGQFVLASGSLIIADLQMLQSMWKLPAIQELLRKSAQEATAGTEPQPHNRHQRRGQEKNQEKVKGKTNVDTSELEIAMQMLPNLPHSGQLHLVGDGFAIWATIAADSLVGPISDLVLKHGAKLAGEWSMIGIMDGRPYDTESVMTVEERIGVGMLQQSISVLSMNFAPFVRQALGRPLGSYGMTPLMVFRQVSH